MTREEILALKPGRELDALVAEKVMGECKHEWEVVGPNVWNLGCCKCYEGYSGFGEKNPPSVGTDKHYSTNISVAWEVATKCNIFEKYPLMRTNYGWGLLLLEYGEIAGCIVSADTAPEAICKAALLAVMHND